MIEKDVVIQRGGDINTFLKVPGLFCLYFDKEKLKNTKTLSNDVPLFLEIEYSENEFRKEKYVFYEHSFDLKREKLVVDHKKKSKVTKDFLKFEFLNKKRNEIMMLLSVFTEKYIFHYPYIQGWFIELENDNFKELQSKYGQLTYLHSFAKEDKNPERLYSKNHEKYFSNPTVFTVRDNNTGKLVDNVSISDMFHFYYNCPSEVKEAVRNATRLYYQSKNHYDVDLSTEFVYLVIALESLIQVEYSGQQVNHCNECKQPIFAVSKKFHAFLKKYYDDYEKVEINKIYSLRSSIVHRGFNIVDPSIFPFEDSLREKEKFYKNESLIRKTRNITKSVINKFLFLNSKGLTAPHNS